MDIFEIDENGVVVPTPQALVIEPFATIYTENERALSLRKFAYIEFMCSYKRNNPFIGYPVEERGVEIIKAVFPSATSEEKDSIRLDPLVIQAMLVYKKNQNKASVSIRFYEAAISAAEKMIGFFTDFNLDERNEKTGHLLYKPADITRALKDVNEVLKTLGGLRENILTELFESAKGKGDREINYFEKLESAKK